MLKRRIMELDATFTLNPQSEVMNIVDIKLFSLISKHKSLRFEEIESKMKDSIPYGKESYEFKDEDEKKEKIKTSLKELEGKGLIKKKTSVIEDFETYYVTAKGLSESRKFSKNF